MSEELDCTFCENFQQIDETLPDSSNPIVVRRYYKCKVDVFDTAYLKSELKSLYSRCTVRIEKTGHKNIDELLTEIDNLNNVFQRTAGDNTVSLIKIDVHFAAAIASPCISQNDFFAKNAFLADTMDMDIEQLRRRVRLFEKEWKGVKLLKQYFSENSMDAEPFGVLDSIIALRNKTPPAHKFSSDEVPTIMQRLGLTYPVETKADWQRHWEGVVLKYTGALRRIRTSIMADPSSFFNRQDA